MASQPADARLPNNEHNEQMTHHNSHLMEEPRPRDLFERSADVAAIRFEAQLFEEAQHRNVAPAPSLQINGDQATLVFEEIEGRTLGEFDKPLSTSAAVMTKLAWAVDHLHSIGITAGSLEANRIMVDNFEHPVLFDLSSAKRVDGDSGAVAADVLAFGKLLDRLCRLTPAQVRASLTDGRPDETVIRARLAEIARDARALKANERPSVRELALRLEQASNLTTETKKPSKHFRMTRRASMTAVVALAVLVAGGVLTTTSLRSPDSAASPERSRPTSSTTVLPAISAIPGGFELAGERYEVGEPGDAFVVGRWTCLQPMLALLRPKTGEIYVFDIWPASDAQVNGRKLASVNDPAISMQAIQHDACDWMSITKSDSTQIQIDPQHTTERL